jgi:hypothetical protein
MLLTLWLIITLGLAARCIYLELKVSRRSTKEGTPSTSTNSKSTQCTCDYDGDKNKVVVYCGKCGGIVE